MIRLWVASLVDQKKIIKSLIHCTNRTKKHDLHKYQNVKLKLYFMTAQRIINAPTLHENDLRHYILVNVMYNANENHMFNYIILFLPTL